MIELFATDRLRELLPRYQQIIREDIIPQEMRLLQQPFKETERELQGFRRKAKEQGLWAPALPGHAGGMGLSLSEFAQISEELGRSPLGHYVFNVQAPDIGNMELLHGYAANHLQERFLKPLVQGDIRSCFSMTEPELAGSNPVRLATTAVRDGKEWVINGHKWFTTAADGASFAIVMAVTEPDNPSPHARASMILVPTDTPGFELVRNIPIMGEAGEGYMSHAEIRYTDCRVPLDHLIGESGQGFMLAQERLGPGRIHHCMRWIGICEQAFDMMCRRALSRELDTDKPLAGKQTIQNWIAESRAEIDAARLMVLHTAHAMQEHGTKAVRQQISTIKFYVANVLMQVLDRAVQTHGALGITDDTVLSFWYRHERGARIYDGPDEVHKSSLARTILKKYQS